MSKLTFEDVIFNLFENMEFETLKIWAGTLGVDWDIESLPDDLWPDRQAELEQECADALINFFNKT
jgi:hypothetical protein